MGRFGAGEAFVFEAGVAEIDQEANGDAGCVQVVDDLGLVFGGDGFDRFEFDQDFSLDEEVGVKIPHDLRAEADLNRFLPLGGETRFREGNVEGFFVNRLQKSRPQLVDHLKATADDLPGKLHMEALGIL